MPTVPLASESLHRLLSRRDLTDPREGPHAMQLLLGDVHAAVAARLAVPRRLCRTLPVRREAPEGVNAVALRLKQDPSGPPPEAVEPLALDAPADVLLVCPGPVFGRTGDGQVHLHGHRLSLWHLGGGAPAATLLPALVQTALRTALPGHHYRLMPASIEGLASCFVVEAHGDDGWVRVGHCGVGRYDGRHATGLVLELEPLLILRKSLPDAELIHSADLRVQTQLQDLSPFVTPAPDPERRAERGEAG